MEDLEFIFSKIEEGKKLAMKNTKSGGEDYPKRHLYLSLRKDIDDFLEDSGSRLITLYGLRGIGKTTLIFQLYRYLTEKKDFNSEDVLYLSLDEVSDFLDQDLYEIITSYVENIHESTITGLDKKIFIFLDEAHFDEKWSKVAKLIYDKSENIFVLATGSSALSLSMSTDTSRRAKERFMFPLNFSEYLMLKHNLFPLSGTTKAIRNVFLSPREENIKRLKKKEVEIQRKLSKLNKPLKKVFRNFLQYGGFAFGLELERDEVLKRTVDIIERMVRRDLPMIKSFNQKTVPLVTKILTFIALQKPGAISRTGLADKLNRSPNMVANILDALEKSQMLFSVKAYGGAGKTTRKPWQYYLLTPTLKAGICRMAGKMEDSEEKMGEFLETMVASYLYKMKKGQHIIQGFYYDSNGGGSDFIVKKGDEEIPVEVGIGSKSKKQVKKTMSRCKNCRFGVNICDVEKTYMDEDVLYIPKKLFSLL